MTTNEKTIDTATFTEEQQQAFVDAWLQAGGYDNDFATPAPWAMPWCHCDTEIRVSGNSIQEWAESYLAQCQAEMEEALDEEAMMLEALAAE